MHNICMKMGDEYKDDALLAASLAKQAGLTQSSIAKAIGASQSQVSRILSGRSVRRSKLLKDVCVYVNQHQSSGANKSAASNPDLMAALNAVWDGSPGHARTLALVIRSLGALSPPLPSVRPQTKKRGK